MSTNNVTSVDTAETIDVNDIALVVRGAEEALRLAEAVGDMLKMSNSSHDLAFGHRMDASRGASKLCDSARKLIAQSKEVELVMRTMALRGAIPNAETKQAFDDLLCQAQKNVSRAFDVMRKDVISLQGTLPYFVAEIAEAKRLNRPGG